LGANPLITTSFSITPVLVFRVTPADTEEHRVRGEIVRVEENEEDPHGLWPMRVAVAFESDLPQLKDILQQMDDAPEDVNEA